ncbi:MAG: TonB-dependent receptor [Aquificae bacterium]|nr:TonB-dependent receptor [Aquificota bacterium]
MKKIFTLLGLVSTSLADESISALLEKYEQAGRLEYKTVQEGEGHVILFSKEDLERMQAYTLKDVLKTIKFYHVYSDRYGRYLFNYSLLFSQNVTTVRLFINDHEVSAVSTRTPFSIWDNIPLDNIDHIEIYLGESAIKFGNEYASVLIKLYTKDPSKENVIYTRISKDLKSGYGFSIYDAREVRSNLSYMLMFNISKFDRKSFDSLSRDAQIHYGYLHIDYSNLHLEASYISKDSDIFLGSALDNRLDDGNFEGNHKYISLTTRLLEDKSLKLTVSFDEIKTYTYEKDQNGLLSCIPNPSIIFQTAKVKTLENSSNIFIQKEYTFDNNKLLISGIYKNRRYELKKEGILINTIPLYTKGKADEEYFSLLMQGESKINKNIFFVAGIRYDNYQRPSNFEDIQGFMIKGEFVHKLPKNIYYKIFGGSFFVPTAFIEVANNPNLQVQKNKFITVELEKKYKKSDIILAVGHTSIKDGIYFNPWTLKFQNLQEELSFTFYSIYAKLKISKTGKILLDIFKIDPNKDILPFSSKEGAGLHVFEKIGKFDTYIGIIYRDGYLFDNIEIDDGIDLTVAVKYRLNDKINIGIKGENLLNKALKVPYVGISQIDTYPSIDRKIYITLVSSF